MVNMATTVDIVHFIEMAISFDMSFHRTTGIGWGNGGFFVRTLKFAIGFPRIILYSSRGFGFCCTYCIQWDH